MQHHAYLGLSPHGFHRLHYTQFGSDDAAYTPVVCAHALTRNGRDFDALAEVLAAEGRRVFCPDVAGRGRSDWLADATLYNYPQYLADMNALIARMDAPQIDWVGTSMGGLIGMLMAAQPNSPIRRMVINDVGPLIPVDSLLRIASYIAQLPVFNHAAEMEKHIRKIYAPFGNLTDEQWRHLTEHSTRLLPDGRLTLAHDPGIAHNFLTLTQDVDLWPYYDRIQCPILLLRGGVSDILTAETALEMTKRGPRAKLVTLEGIGHAPALMAADQIKLIADFLS